MICLRKEKFIKITEGFYKLIFAQQLDKYGTLYKRDVLTSRLSSIKAGGIAKYILYPKNPQELILLLKLCRSLQIRYKILGGCTNTFFCDSGFDGAIISTKKMTDVFPSERAMIAEAGVPLVSMLKKARDFNLELKSELFGIPGSVGGAIRNNAGAFGTDISEIFLGGEFYDPLRDKVIYLNSNDLEFSYRYSLLGREPLVFLRGSFKAKKNDSGCISEGFLHFLNKRKSAQPTCASLGSFFKRSANIIPAQLIDKAGLKGKSIGDAEISKKHAGFIINNGKATADEIDRLAKLAENTVFEKYNVRLVREAELIV